MNPMAKIRETQVSIPSIEVPPKKTASEIQEAKRIEKMQTVCSSHRTAGSATAPDKPSKS